MVKFGGEIGTLYQIFTPCKMRFKKHPLQNRTNVQTKGGGVKSLLNNVKKNCTFLNEWLPLAVSVVSVRGDLTWGEATWLANYTRPEQLFKL